MPSPKQDFSLRWTITADERQHFKILWDSINKTDGIKRIRALEIIEARGVRDVHQKNIIFELADCNKDGKWTLPEFQIALLLCDKVNANFTLPELLPLTLLESVHMTIAERPNNSKRKRSLEEEREPDIKPKQRPPQESLKVANNQHDRISLSSCTKEELIDTILKLKSELENARTCPCNHSNAIDESPLTPILDFNFERSVNIVDSLNSIRPVDAHKDGCFAKLSWRFRRMHHFQIGLVAYYFTCMKNMQQQIPPADVLHGLSDITWLQMIVSLTEQCTEPSGSKNGRFGYCYCSSDNLPRYSVRFTDKNRFPRAIMGAKLIMFFVYGYQRPHSKTASHLCGNGRCLSPLHIFPETMELNMSRNIHHDTGVFGDDCNHVPRCLESKKKGRTRVPITNPDDQRRMPLLPDYFKPTTIGTLKLVVEDHVYFEMPSHTGYWNCMNTFQNLCTAFATIHGDELVLNHEHTDECDRRTAEYLNLPKRILENINPNSFVYSQLDETSVKRNSAGNIVSFVLGDHKYCRTMNGDPTETWRCTIDYCYAHAYLFEEEMVACESVAIHTCKRVRMQQMKTNPFPQYDNENIQIPAGIFEQLTESNFMRHEDGTIYEVIIDNQRYRKYHQNNKGYWKCIKENCNVRLYMDNNFQFYAFGASVHNHKKRIRRKSVKT